MANKDCEKVLDLLNEYIDGVLNASDAELVRSHTENCDKCRAALDELKKIEELFNESTEEAPEALCDRVMASVKAEKAASRKKTVFIRRFGIAAVAAVICLTVLASPMLIMVATGGAKAEADCLDAERAPSIEDLLTGNGAAKDDYYSVIENASSDNSKSDILDAIKDLVDNGKAETEAEPGAEPLLVDSGEYRALLLDGSEVSLYIDTNEYTAKIGEVEYELKTAYESNTIGTTYILASENELLYFEVVSHGSVIFKQIEK